MLKRFFYARVYSDTLSEHDNETKTYIQTRTKYTPEYITTGKGTHRLPNEGKRHALVFQKMTIEVYCNVMLFIYFLVKIKLSC